MIKKISEIGIKGSWERGRPNERLLKAYGRNT